MCINSFSFVLCFYLKEKFQLFHTFHLNLAKILEDGNLLTKTGTIKNYEIYNFLYVLILITKCILNVSKLNATIVLIN